MAFSNRIEDFHAANAEVLGISVDSQFSHLAWTNTERAKGGLGKLGYPLVSDLTKNISRDYGVLLEGPQIALRGTFIVDPEGNIQASHVHNLPVGRSVDETLRVIEAFQHVSGSSGEVCPANCTKGGEAIQPNAESTASYVAKQ